MRLYNLTDIETPLLRKKGLVNKVCIAGRAVVEPGKFIDIGDDPLVRRDALAYVAVGAMSVDLLPPEYEAAKMRRNEQQQARGEWVSGAPTAVPQEK